MKPTPKELGDQPAFPLSQYHAGLTKRELFAALAFHAFGHPHTEFPLCRTQEEAKKFLGVEAYDNARDWPKVIARQAAIYADALIAELAKKGAE